MEKQENYEIAVDRDLKDLAKTTFKNINEELQVCKRQFDKKFNYMAILNNKKKQQLTVKAYECIFEDRANKQFILNGGRVSGKSRQIYMEVVFYMISHAYRDCIVCRANDNSMQTSSYAEIQNLIYELGLENYFDFSSKPLRIKLKGDKGSIYFIGVSGADTSRTRSFKSKYPVGVLIFEELQQVRGLENLEQAMTSFRRLLDMSDWRIFYVFNPPPQNAHWVNAWANLKAKDPDYKLIHTSYLDILPFVNDLDLKEILKCKMFDYDKYENMYMGVATGGYGSIYPMFKPDVHVLKEEQFLSKFGGRQIAGLIIGVDSAVTHDSTCFSPMAVFDNGQCCILNLFYHDPKISGVKSSNELVTISQTWFKMLCKKYNLITNYNTMKVPIVFKVDSASADMIRELQYQYTTNDGMVTVESFKKPTVCEMISRVQSAWARNVVFILDTGGYRDFVTNRFVSVTNPVSQNFQALIWNEKQTGYDPVVPNDASDSATYAICTYFLNPDNLYWLESVKKADYYDVNVSTINNL